MLYTLQKYNTKKSYFFLLTCGFFWGRNIIEMFPKEKPKDRGIFLGFRL